MSRLWLRAIFLLSAAIFALASPAGAQAAGSCSHSDAQASRQNLKEVRSAILCLVNRERAAHGLRALRASGKLRRAAGRHSADMVRRRYFDHVSPNGADLVKRARRTGYVARTSSWKLAENLGWSGGSLATASTMVKMWMNSPKHRDNILRADMQHLGVGLAAGTPQGGRGLTGTLLFGRRG